jgi:hypothetical protein
VYLIYQKRFYKACAHDIGGNAFVRSLRALHRVLPSIVAKWVRHAILLPNPLSLGEEWSVECDVQWLHRGCHPSWHRNSLILMSRGEFEDGRGEVAGVRVEDESAGTIACVGQEDFLHPQEHHSGVHLAALRVV